MPTIKGIKTAILIYKDPKLGDRRVVFGEPDKCLQLLIDNSPILFRRFQDIIKENPITKSIMIKAIKKTKEWFSKSHGKGAYKKAEMTLSYKIKKLK